MGKRSGGYNIPFLDGVHLETLKLELILNDVHLSKSAYPVLRLSIGAKFSTERPRASLMV